MTEPKPIALLASGDRPSVRALTAFLRERGFETCWARNGESAFHVLDEEPVQFLVTELRLEGGDGLEVLRRARARNPEVCAVMVAEEDDVGRALEAMRQGAYDFQLKPLNLEKLAAVLERGLSHQRLVGRVAEMEGRLEERYGLEQFAGRSRAVARVLDQVRQVAPTRATVLIEGEAGTGKGLLAQAIHQNSPRRDQRFVWMRCGTLGEAEIERELFGEEAGPPPGAAPRHGRLELADGGTLFVDEVGEMSPAVQAKLLRVLQDREFERVGGSETLRVDVRMIAATEADLAERVASGAFREDLFYRLGVARIAMPALRERADDIPLLVESFIREFNRRHARRVTGITPGAAERLRRYGWPGNVRELRSVVEGMVASALGRRPLDVSDLPDRLRGRARPPGRLTLTVGMTIEEAERQLIAATLRHTGGDKQRAAQLLGIGLRTLYRKIARYRIR